MKCSKTNRAIDVELFKVCAEGTVEEVRELLSRGANPSEPVFLSVTLVSLCVAMLHYCCKD